jgi:thiol-disulfide isomerase/thioredoxin
VVGGAVAVVLVVTIILTFGSGSASEPLEAGEPTVTGAFLPTLAELGGDPAIGLDAPEVTGADWNGDPVSISNDGRAKMIVFLAHWCPHCQNEVPIVQDWLDATDLPDGVDIYSVATDMRRTADNYPPSRWLEREGWEPPVVLDDAAGTVRAAFGLNAYPYWVFVSADGTVAGRLSGALPADSLDAVAASLVQP